MSPTDLFLLGPPLTIIVWGANAVAFFIVALRVQDGPRMLDDRRLFFDTVTAIVLASIGISLSGAIDWLTEDIWMPVRAIADLRWTLIGIAALTFCVRQILWQRGTHPLQQRP